MKWRMSKRKEKEKGEMFVEESHERGEVLEGIKEEGSKRKGRGRKTEMENEKKERRAGLENR